MLRLLAIALLPCPFHLFFPSYCDISQALSYCAATIVVDRNMTKKYKVFICLYKNRFYSSCVVDICVASDTDGRRQTVPLYNLQCTIVSNFTSRPIGTTFNPLSLPSPFSSILKLRNKQFPSLPTVCTDNPSIISLFTLALFHIWKLVSNTTCYHFTMKPKSRFFCHFTYLTKASC
jgi:hypothetical protein